MATKKPEPKKHGGKQKPGDARKSFVAMAAMAGRPKAPKKKSKE